MAARLLHWCKGSLKIHTPEGKPKDRLRTGHRLEEWYAGPACSGQGGPAPGPETASPNSFLAPPGAKTPAKTGAACLTVIGTVWFEGKGECKSVYISSTAFFRKAGFPRIPIPPLHCQEIRSSRLG